jgi:hypothetical protein
LNVKVHNYSYDHVQGQEILYLLTKEAVWNANSTQMQDTLGILPLFCGMMVMITKNVAI